ncbi:kinase-like domain-containing protein [Rhizophagus irregularis DAOM 181602=DAOM 197198]|uniref:non-specific serine/threonine protein kinase n=1 Tax=Rhizophagus irregularis (strain DAOM 181602 / DAOM 197198 / MUCL 43194) TaxID=747089 RepID=A0A2P4PZT6_RHIID|nr:kinase-like domain-containing protein [Rhizophagus irregularis DAOM 181602=DAOM 197198]POG70901.1 kinase-like domain-containing protein [Rhizophagus irregularis DAOM 181602=DAOM 197198]|eukprot:XP_025177767.1 kinase-like domain-containing protein [Rhizophagus irregularis DAOM 181602=DAOM 197198]
MYFTNPFTIGKKGVKARSCFSYLDFLRRPMPHNCSKCNQCKIDKLPCQPCIQERYQKEYENWSCGNEKIDKLVKYVRPSLINTILFLEWIPYEDLEIDKKDFAEGGFGTISLATWINGYVVRWNHNKKQWHRQGKMQVVIKTMKDNISDNFITELEAYFKCASRHLISYLGITQNPDTKDYAIVMEFAENGDLRTYLQNNKAKLYWRRKLDILRNIVAGLEIIHVTGMTHRDLHTGNILQFKDLLYPSRITDLGLSKQASEEKTEKIIGVTPYIAPEVLNKNPYSEASDIYSFAMILWEVGTGEKPYADLADDEALADQIKRGRRPNIPKEMPECYATLIRNCWNSDPQKRPTALDIKEKIMEWQSVLGWFPTEVSRNDEEAKQFEEADDEKSKEDRRYRAKIYNPPPKPQEPSAEVDDDQDRELPDIDDELLDDNNDSPDDISKESQDDSKELPDGISKELPDNISKELLDDSKELLNDNKESPDDISKELPNDISKELLDDSKELLNDNKESPDVISKELPDDSKELSDDDDGYEIPDGNIFFLIYSSSIFNTHANFNFATDDDDHEILDADDDDNREFPDGKEL